MKRNLICLILTALLLVSCAPSGGLIKYAPINFNPVYEKAKTAVVRVNSYIIFNKKKMLSSKGSGFIIDENGFGLTNCHVIDTAEVMEIEFIDGTKYDAKIIGKDPNTDLAVFKIEGEKFPYLKPADSSKLKVGSWVVALGAPYDMPFSLTEGIVSAFRLHIGHSTYDDMIQTSAAINPGNSGGPLLDMDGNVVGINTVKLKLVRTAGIGFAISSNLAWAIIPMLKKYGEPLRGFIGARIIENEKIVKISEILKNYPAEIAGLRVDDIILFINRQTISDAKTMYTQVAMAMPGERSDIVVLRGDRIITIYVTPVKRFDYLEQNNTAVKNESKNKIKTYSDLNDSQSDEYFNCIYSTLERYKNLPDKKNFTTLDGAIVPMKDLYKAGLPKNFHYFKSKISTGRITASTTAKNAVEIKIRNWYRPVSECLARAFDESITKINKADIREIYRTDGTFLGFSVWNGKQNLRVYVNPAARPREAL